MNPECRAGKHANCDEKGWRDDLGHIGPCLCGCHENVLAVEVPKPAPAYERPVDLDSTEYRDWGKEPPSDTDAFGRHGYLIASVEGKDPADLEPGDKVHITPLDFGIPRCPNCDMSLDGPHDFRCPIRVGL